MAETELGDTVAERQEELVPPAPVPSKVKGGHRVLTLAGRQGKGGLNKIHIQPGTQSERSGDSEGMRRRSRWIPEGR